MPLYDLACDSCRECFEDEVLSLVESDHPTCPKCGQECRIVLQVGRPVGPTDTNPVVIDSIGQTFTSAQQIRDYEKREGGLLSPTDSKWQAVKDHSRERVERTSKKLGFSSWEQRADHLRHGGHNTDRRD